MAKKIKTWKVRVIAETTVFATNREDAKNRAETLVNSTSFPDHEGVAEFAGFVTTATAWGARIDKWDRTEEMGFAWDTSEEYYARGK